MKPHKFATACPQVIQWLELLHTIRSPKQRATMRKECHGYEGIHGFLLRHGQPFKFKPKPKRLPWGPERHCYGNAFLLALHCGYDYCEGFAMGPIPVEHAWCVDAKGRVIDNTWREDDGMELFPREYFGVRIKIAYVIKHRQQTGHNSIVGAWDDAYPITRAKPSEWKVK